MKMDKHSVTIKHSPLQIIGVRTIKNKDFSYEFKEGKFVVNSEQNKGNEMNDRCPKKEKDCANCKIADCPEEYT
jgi:hypothetical protein